MLIRFKDPLAGLLIHPDPRIFYANVGHIALRIGLQRDFAPVGEFDGVMEQVIEYLNQPVFIGPDGRKVIRDSDPNLYRFAVEQIIEHLQKARHDGLQPNGSKIQTKRVLLQPGGIQQIIEQPRHAPCHGQLDLQLLTLGFAGRVLLIVQHALGKVHDAMQRVS
ncbi:hypothetical protein D3C76_681150 [compost metagenome]